MAIQHVIAALRDDSPRQSGGLGLTGVALGWTGARRRQPAYILSYRWGFIISLGIAARTIRHLAVVNLCVASMEKIAAFEGRADIVLDLRGLLATR
jgi:hypothetical protein